jgi:hypothetical protein
MQFAVGKFQQWAGEPLLASDFTDDLVNRWLRSLECAGKAPNTLKNRRVVVLTLWRYAFELGLIDTLPRRVRRFRVPASIPCAWSAEELSRLFAFAANLDGDGEFFTRPAIDRRLSNLRHAKRNGGENDVVSCIRHCDYWTAWLRVQYDSALRLGDMLRLLRHDITPEGKVSLVQRKSDRAITFRLRPETVAAVDRMAPKDKDEPIFAVASRRILTLHFRRLVKAAGLTGGTHKVRKTSATMIEALHPGSAMAHLGHKTPELAYRTYVDPRYIQQNKPLPPLPTDSGTKGGDA